jgi:transcriptional regulator with XRE-family HTH domain
MSFRENLREVLSYNDIEQKELAAKAGISLRSLENYVREESSMPAADRAIRIAKALGVTVEYLINGGEPSKAKDSLFINLSLRQLGQSLEKLSEGDRKVVYETARHLAETLLKQNGKGLSKRDT